MCLYTYYMYFSEKFYFRKTFKMIPRDILRPTCNTLNCVSSESSMMAVYHNSHPSQFHEIYLFIPTKTNVSYNLLTMAQFFVGNFRYLMEYLIKLNKYRYSLWITFFTRWLQDDLERSLEPFGVKGTSIYIDNWFGAALPSNVILI